MAHDTDVLIIGAGAIGLSSAYYLRQKGLSVRIVEKGVPGSGRRRKLRAHLSKPLCAAGPSRRDLVELKWMLDPVSPFYVKPRLDPGSSPGC